MGMVPNQACSVETFKKFDMQIYSIKKVTFSKFLMTSPYLKDSLKQQILKMKFHIMDQFH